MSHYCMIELESVGEGYLLLNQLTHQFEKIEVIEASTVSCGKFFIFCGFSQVETKELESFISGTKVSKEFTIWSADELDVRDALYGFELPSVKENLVVLEAESLVTTVEFLLRLRKHVSALNLIEIQAPKGALNKSITFLSTSLDENAATTKEAFEKVKQVEADFYQASKHIRVSCIESLSPVFQRYFNITDES